MLIDQFGAYVRMKNYISRDYLCMQLSILSIVRTEKNFLSSGATAAFVISFTLALKVLVSKGKQSNILSQIFAKVLSDPQKEYIVLLYQNVFYFHSFIMKHLKAKLVFKTTFICHFNPLECFMLFANDNLHLHCVDVVKLLQPLWFLCCRHKGFTLYLLFSQTLSFQTHKLESLLFRPLLKQCLLLIPEQYEQGQYNTVQS